MRLLLVLTASIPVTLFVLGWQLANGTLLLVACPAAICAWLLAFTLAPQRPA